MLKSNSNNISVKRTYNSAARILSTGRAKIKCSNNTIATCRQQNFKGCHGVKNADNRLCFDFNKSCDVDYHALYDQHLGIVIHLI